MASPELSQEAANDAIAFVEFEEGDENDSFFDKGKS